MKLGDMDLNPARFEVEAKRDDREAFDLRYGGLDSDEDGESKVGGNLAFVDLRGTEEGAVIGEG